MEQARTLIRFDTPGAAVPEKVLVNGEVFVRETSSQARLSEAVKVLEPFAHLGYVILSEAPPNAFHAQLFTDSEGGVHTVSLEQFRAARQFLATLGEENE